MRLSSFAFVASLSLFSLPALAQDDPAASTPAPKPAPEKKVCRSVEVTGSIMGKRICHTKAEWVEFDRLNQQNAESALDKRREGKGGE